MSRSLCGLLVLLLLVGCKEGEGDSSRLVVSTEGAPKAIGPYSQGIVAGSWLFCSGQIALDPKTGRLVNDSIEAETRRVLDNLKAVLEAGGATTDDVVRATVYLTDLADYKAVNKVYAEYFAKARPARAAVQVAKLPRGASVEISCIAVRR